jgi:hypothetical protein
VKSARRVLFQAVTLAFAVVAGLAPAARANCTPAGGIQSCIDVAGNQGEQACLGGSWSPCETIASWYAPGNGCSSSSDCPVAANATASCDFNFGPSPWCIYTCNPVDGYWMPPNQQRGDACGSDNIANSGEAIQGLDDYSYTSITVAELETVHPYVVSQPGATYLWMISGGTFSNQHDTAGEDVVIDGVAANEVSISAGSGIVEITVLAISPWDGTSMVSWPKTLKVVTATGQPVLDSRAGFAFYPTDGSTPAFTMIQVANSDWTATYDWSVTGGSLMWSSSGPYGWVVPDGTASTMNITCTNTTLGLSGTYSLPVYTEIPPPPVIQFQAAAETVGGTYMMAWVPNRGRAYQATYSWIGLDGVSSVLPQQTDRTAFVWFNVTGAVGTLVNIGVTESTQYWTLSSTAPAPIVGWPRQSPAIYLADDTPRGVTISASVDVVQGMTYRWSIDGGVLTSSELGAAGGPATNTAQFYVTVGPGEPFTIHVSEVNAAGIVGAPGSKTALAGSMLGGIGSSPPFVRVLAPTIIPGHTSYGPNLLSGDDAQHAITGQFEAWVECGNPGATVGGAIPLEAALPYCLEDLHNALAPNPRVRWKFAPTPDADYTSAWLTGAPIFGTFEAGYWSWQMRYSGASWFYENAGGKIKFCGSFWTLSPENGAFTLVRGSRSCGIAEDQSQAAGHSPTVSGGIYVSEPIVVTGDYLVFQPEVYTILGVNNNLPTTLIVYTGTAIAQDGTPQSGIIAPHFTAAATVCSSGDKQCLGECVPGSQCTACDPVGTVCGETGEGACGQDETCGIIKPHYKQCGAAVIPQELCCISADCASLPLANGNYACVSNACVLTCNSGYQLCNNECLSSLACCLPND